MSYYEKKMGRRDILLGELIEETESLGIEFPLDLKAASIKRSWTNCGDRAILAGLLRDMGVHVIEHNNKVIRTWHTIKMLNMKDNISEEEKAYRNNLYIRFATLVGQDVANKWDVMSVDDRWNAIQNMCTKFHWQYRIKSEDDIWTCVNAYSKFLKQEASVRRAVKMPLAAYMRNPEVVTDIPDDKNLLELYAIKLECMNTAILNKETTQCNNERLKNVTMLIAKKEKKEGHTSESDENGDDNETIRKLLQGDS